MFLNDALFLSKGGERTCYIHPDDKQKVVKVVHCTQKHDEQNKLEYRYYKFLEKRNTPLTHLSVCLGWIDTNLGEGLIYNRVMNYDHTFSISFKEYLEKKVFFYEEELRLVNDLQEYLFQNEILFIDVDLSNLFCQEESAGKFKLVIVDGLGARRLNWKFYLYLVSSWYRRYKIKKQWKKFYNNYLRCSTYTTV